MLEVSGRELQQLVPVTAPLPLREVSLFTSTNKSEPTLTDQPIAAYSMNNRG
jgi:hypothetical protein